MREALEWVFGAGHHCAYLPKSAEEVDAIASACLDPGEVNLLIDEAHYWLTTRRGGEGPLLQLMRAHRHARVNVLCTTQHFTGDIPHAAHSCAPTLYVFRSVDDDVLVALKRKGFDPEIVRNLAQFQHVDYCQGFSGLDTRALAQ